MTMCGEVMTGPGAAGERPARPSSLLVCVFGARGHDLGRSAAPMIDNRHSGSAKDAGCPVHVHWH